MSDVPPITETHPTGQLRRCPCEWLWPPAGMTHIDSCEKSEPLKEVDESDEAYS